MSEITDKMVEVTYYYYYFFFNRNIVRAVLNTFNHMEKFDHSNYWCLHIYVSNSSFFKYGNIKMVLYTCIIYIYAWYHKLR